MTMTSYIFPFIYHQYPCFSWQYYSYPIYSDSHFICVHCTLFYKKVDPSCVKIYHTNTHFMSTGMLQNDTKNIELQIKNNIICTGIFIGFLINHLLNMSLKHVYSINLPSNGKVNKKNIIWVKSKTHFWTDKVTSYLCVLEEKRGYCPARSDWGGLLGACAPTCQNDADCPGDNKCCHKGCGLQCVPPVGESVWSVDSSVCPQSVSQCGVTVCVPSRWVSVESQLGFGVFFQLPPLNSAWNFSWP